MKKLKEMKLTDIFSEDIVESYAYLSDPNQYVEKLELGDERTVENQRVFVLQNFFASMLR